MANPSNVYIVAVETVAILSLTLIALMGMYKGQNEIAAAAVGGIAGFISHKGLSKASSESEKKSAEPETTVKTTNEEPVTKLESEPGLESEIKPKNENKEKISEEESEIEEDVA
jgi:phage terminase small subunit